MAVDKCAVAPKESANTARDFLAGIFFTTFIFTDGSFAYIKHSYWDTTFKATKYTLIILIRLWRLPMIDYEMQIEGENLGRGLIILRGITTSDRCLRIVIPIGPG